MTISKDSPASGADLRALVDRLGGPKIGRAGRRSFGRKRTAEVHRLYPPVSESEEQLVTFSFRVENFPHIQAAFGSAAGYEALDRMRRIASDVIGPEGTVLVDMDGGLRVMLRDPSGLGTGPIPAACRRLAEAFCGALPMVPLPTSAGPVCLWLSGSWTVGQAGGAPGETGATSQRFAGAPAQTGAAWAERYRDDMAQAVRIMAAIERTSGIPSDRLMLFWQPVSDGRAVCYREATLRFVEAGGGPRSAAREILALERLGLVRCLDRFVVGQVLAELEECPDAVLGVNISAQSVRGDGWWDEVGERLSRRPDLARRLLIEITETTAFPDISDAVRFVARMHCLGCRIVLDDFGTGLTSIRHLLAMAPDMVKIDRFFLRRATQSDRDREIFLQLVRFAGAVGAVVIVEGVETRAQAVLAASAGDCWQQGHYWGQPMAARAWCLPPPGLRADQDTEQGVEE